jgi:hypothetical protein
MTGIFNVVGSLILNGVIMEEHVHEENGQGNDTEEPKNPTP